MEQAVLVGSDPEYFVQKHGKISHAIGLLGGTKNKPRAITWDQSIPTGHVQEDNVLVEFNTTPTDNAEKFASHMKEVLQAANRLLPVGVMPAAISSYNYNEEEIQQLPIEAFTFGCDPDMNAYYGRPNPIPTLTRDSRGFRSAGGHVHLGFDHLLPDGLETEVCLQVGQMCDITLGLWGVISGDDIERKKLYGRAGAIRIKPYGIEYRTLGNFWIWSPSTIKEVHRRAQLAVTDRARLEEIHALFPPEEIQETINTGNTERARYILEVVGYV